MKGVLIIIDGMGDLPCDALKGKTPLEAASCENLDYLASHGKLGYMYPIKENVVPESDTAVLSVLGQGFQIGYRGQLEALGTDLDIKHGDLALRTNFATVEDLKSKKVIDRRAGRTLTTREANILTKEINKRVKLPCKFIFKNTVQHRGVLILRGGFSDNITNTDPEYHLHGKSNSKNTFRFSEPLDDDDDSKHAADMVNKFIEQSYRILNEHQINYKRRKRGMLPANIILTRDASTDLPRLKKFKRWASIVNMPLELGISKALDIHPFFFEYPKTEGYDVYETLYSGLKKMCKFAKKTLKKRHKKYDYFYIHFKETDVPGHDNKPHEKQWMIEYIDNHFFSFLRKFAEKNKIKVIVTADHSTPCKLKVHSANPVPVLLCDWGKEKKQQFGETQAKKGELGKLYGKNILKLF